MRSASSSKTRTLFLALVAMFPLCVEVANAGDIRGAAPLFVEELPLDVTIEAPLQTLMRERPDVVYLRGTFSYAETDGTVRTLDLRLRTRGNYRRDEEHCDFAPIRLDFRKGQVDDTLLAGQDKLKLVTHCRSDSLKFDQYVLREYLAYRLLQALTPVSYSVRLLRITYEDGDTGNTMTRLGFVIEDDEAVAARNGLNVIKTDRIAESDIDRTRRSLVHLFEYMIGNTEYSFTNPEPDKHCCHNSDVLSASNAPPYFPLPYDFDFAGLVNAPYAEPNPRFPIRNVRERHYRGQCADNDLLPELLRLFVETQDDFDRILDEVFSFADFSPRHARRYVDSFFRKVSSPWSVQKSLIGACYEPVS